MGIFTRASGLDRLAQRYPAAQIPAGTLRHKQTVQIGVVRYRRCVTVGIGPAGLYLWVQPPLGKQAQVQIPWREVKKTGKTKVFGRQGMQLSIGEPEIGDIRVYRELFRSMETFLHTQI